MRALSKVALLRPPTSDEQIAEMRSHVRDNALDRPGVYRMIAGDGEIVYVGKSKRVRSRLLSYFRAAFPEEKGARILRDAERIEWEYVPSEFAALLAELRLIKQFRPRFNVAMKHDGRNYCFIKVTKGPAPKLMVVRGPGADDSAIYYGPFMGAMGVSESVRELNDVLGLRDCAADQQMNFADQSELFDAFPRTPGCIRFEVKKCLGPCVGGCTTQQYDQRLALARAFLDGTDDGPIERRRVDVQPGASGDDDERKQGQAKDAGRADLLRQRRWRARRAPMSPAAAGHVDDRLGPGRMRVLFQRRSPLGVDPCTIGAHRPDLVLHGHAHHGSPEGLIGEVRVRNVALQVIGADFALLRT